MRTFNIGKWQETIRRKTAAFLTVVMMVQTPLSAWAAVEPYAESSSGTVTFDIRDKGNPSSAFSSLDFEAGTKVGEDNTFILKFDGVLNDGWTMEQFDELVYGDNAGGTIIEPDVWEEDEFVRKDHPSCRNYYEYLDSLTDEELKEISFSCTFSDKTEDGENVFSIPGNMGGEIVTNDGIKLGSYTVKKEKDKMIFTGTLLRSVYYRTNVTFGIRAKLEFDKTYEAGTDITITPGTGDVDFVVTPNPNGESKPENTGYKLKKAARTEGTTGIVYTVTAAIEATPSSLDFYDAATASSATASSATSSSAVPSVEHQREIVRRGKAKRKAARAAENRQEDSEESEDDDDFPGDPDEPDYFNGPGVVKSYAAGRVSSAAELPDDTTGGDLTGKVITDRISEELQITEITVQINGGAEKPVYPEAESASSSDCQVNEDGQITYTIPALEDGTPVTEAVLEIHTRLSDAAFNKYLMNGAAVDLTFPNKAYLKGDGGELLAISDRVEPHIELGSPFNKGVKPIAHSNKIFEWTLTANSWFSNASVRLYAVDRIENIEKTHQYRADDGVTIDGERKVIVKLGTLLTGDAADQYSYEHMTGITAIDSFLEAYGTELSGHESDVILYEYEVERDGATQKDAVLLIPLSEYKNQEVEITYKTDAVIPDYTASSSDLQDQYTTDLKNDAKILWKWPEGSGVGTEDFGGADIQKTYPVDYSLVKKTAYDPTSVEPDPVYSYREDTNTITWYFEINQLQLDITDLEITDVFNDKELKLTDAIENGQEKLILTPVTESVTSENTIKKERAMGEAEREVLYWDGAQFPKPDDYYQIEKDIEKNTTTFKLYLSKVEELEHYYFTLETKVMKFGDSKLDQFTIDNTASVSAGVSGHPVKFETSASCPLDNTIIVKSAIPVVEGSELYYDYTNNTVKWRVTFNQRKLTLGDVTLIDRLPTGTSLQELTGAGYGKTVSATEIPKQEDGGWSAGLTPGGSDGNAVKVKVTERSLTEAEEDQQYEYSAADSKYPQKLLTFEFYDQNDSKGQVTLDQPVTVEFTTFVDEAYRKDKFKSNNNADKVSLLNKAILNGKLNGESFTASDTAENAYMPQPNQKSGQYYKTKTQKINGTDKEVSLIEWSLLVNRTSEDIAGAVLTDKLKDFMELLPDTMQVQAVKVNANGEPDKNTAVTLYPNNTEPDLFAFKASNNKDKIDCDGFACTIPKDTLVDASAGDGSPWKGVKISSTPLLFTFTSVMVDDAYKSEITNNVSIKGGGIDDETGEVAADNSSDFRTDSYATAKGVYFTKIYKTSANENGKYPLDKTTFKIEKLKTPENGDGGKGSAQLSDWKEVDSDAKVKSRTTKSSGKTTFMFLEPGAMYQITETKAHEGYALSTDVWNVVILGDSTPSSETVTYPDLSGGNDITVSNVMHHLYIHDASDGKTHYNNLTIQNKVDPSESGPGDIAFVKKGQGGQILPGTEFTLSRKNLGTRRVAADDEGTVTFEAVDPNKNDWYTITETVPTGYKEGDPLRVQLKKNKEGEYQLNFKDNKDFTLPSDVSLGILTNKPITGSGSFKKVDQNGDPITSPKVSFKVERRGDGGQALENATYYDSSDRAVIIDVDKEGAIENPARYVDYLRQEILTANEGIVTFNDFLHGDYKLTEIIGEDSTLPLIDKTELAVLYLHIDKNGVYASDHCDATTGKVSSDTKLTETDDPAYSVTNELQYGFVQIHKVLGEKTATGALVPEMVDEKYINLAGISFNIYKDSDGNGKKDSDTPVMTLITGADGKFPITIGTDGKKTYSSNGKRKVLLTGNYVLQEASADGYNIDSTQYQFTIPEWTEENSDNNPPMAYVASGTSTAPATATSVFMNEPMRKPVELTKKDDVTGELLSGATFKIYTAETGGNYVADLVAKSNEQNDSGTYVLANPPENSGTKKNASGIDYLHADKKGDPLKLLTGTYYIEETTAPGNYQKPDKRFELTVNGDGATVSGDNTLDGTVLQNELIKHDVRIRKLMETMEVSNNKANHFGYEWGSGFKFTLQKDATGSATGPINGAKFDPRVATTKNETENGTAVFENISVGTYRLTETDVPDEYKNDTEWAVEKMPDILVEVTANGVTYKKYEGTNTTPTSLGTLDNAPAEGEQKKQDIPAVYQAGSKDAVLAVYNNYQLGGAHGTKVGVIGNIADGNSPQLSDAEFKLTNTKHEEYSFTATSVNGTLTFNENTIPYGTYTLTETKAPDGYKEAASSIEVKIYGNDVLLKTAGQPDTDGKLLNTAMTKSVQFKKVDQNGDPLKSDRVETTFNVKRIADGQMPAFDDKRTFANDNNGVVTITGLTYGVYEVSEKVSENDGKPAVIENPEKVKFYIKVEKGATDGTGKTTTKVSMGSQLTEVGMSASVGGTDAVSLTQTDDNDMFDFSGSANTYAVTNNLKYGLIDVKKTAADDDGNGKLVSTGKLLPGVVFKIYEDVNGDGEKDDGDKEVLTAVTGSDGRLRKNAENKYLGENGEVQDYRLVYGKRYLLHEEKLPENLTELYAPDAGFYPFEITEKELGETVYIGAGSAPVKSNAPKDAEGFLTVTGSDGEKLAFLNGPIIRGTISLTKTDSETHENVGSAEFDIYVQGSKEKVAMLRDEGNNGVYVLRPGTDGYVLTNASGQEYVKKQSDGTSYQLLKGAYYIKETGAPSGYQIQEDSYWYFTLNKDNQSIGNSNLKDGAGSDADGKDFTNALWRREITVVKQVEQFTKDTWREPTAADGIFTFHLVGTPSNLMPKINKTAMVEVSGANAGKAVFKDIPSGRYVLTEELTGTLPDGRNMADVYVQPEPIEVVVDENGVSYDGKSAANTANTVDVTDAAVTVRNRLKRGSIAGKKMTEDAGGKFALAGAVFELAPVNPAFGESGVRTAVSKADGSIEFNNLPLGTYKLRETEAPQNYEIDDTVYTVDVLEEGVTVRRGSDGSGSDGSGSQTGIEFVDQAVSSITLEKTAEMLSETDLSGTVGPGEGFEFRISGASFEKTDITELMENGRIQVTGASLVEARSDGKDGPGLYVVTDASGKVTVSGLPVGEYQVTEVENEKNGADGIYVRDTEIRAANVEINHSTGKVSEPAVAVHNRLKRSEIQGLKTRTDGTTVLSGAVIGLFPADAAEYTEATLFREQKVTTGEDGVFRFTDIPYGEYQIRELSAPSGYYLNDTTVLKVKVTEDGKVITRGETSEGEAALLIKNNKRSSGGGGGGGGGNPGSPDPSKPGVGPGAPTDPANPEDPANPVNPENPEETLPGETTEPLPTIPVEPDEEGGTVVIVPPDTPPGTDVVVTDRDHHTVYEGKTESDGNVHVQLPPGEYILVTIADDGVPLAQMTFIIPDDEIPLAKAPDAGDHAVPIALLVVVLLGALTGAGIVLKKRSELEEEE